MKEMQSFEVLNQLKTSAAWSNLLNNIAFLSMQEYKNIYNNGSWRLKEFHLYVNFHQSPWLIELV